jgi:hypothetical protein
MVFRCTTPLLLVALASSVPITLAAEPPMPWTFNSPPAEGYSIHLASIEPVPGTPLVRGSLVSFKISATYEVSIADRATVSLLFEDENDHALLPGSTPVAKEVQTPRGTVSMEQTITIPGSAKEVRLYIPVFPVGVAATTGEIIVRYPIVANGK